MPSARRSCVSSSTKKRTKKKPRPPPKARWSSRRPLHRYRLRLRLRLPRRPIPHQSNEMSPGGGPGNRDWGRRAFSPKRRRSIAAMAEALLSDEDERGLLVAPLRELIDRVVDEFDLLVGAGSSDLCRGFRALAWLIEWLPIFMIGAFSRASRLPLARRVLYLESIE